jgi:hypothetical protein
LLVVIIKGGFQEILIRCKQVSTGFYNLRQPQNW